MIRDECNTQSSWPNVDQLEIDQLDLQGQHSAKRPRLASKYLHAEQQN